MRPEQRYERFEPITVRTAARVLQLQRAGVISEREAEFYLRELLAMDAHAGEQALSNLVSAAQRRPATRRIKSRNEGSRRQATPRAARPGVAESADFGLFVRRPVRAGESD